MVKLDDDQITYFDTDEVTFICDCGSEITILANDREVCPHCDREYETRVKCNVHQVDEDEEVEEEEEEE